MILENLPSKGNTKQTGQLTPDEYQLMKTHSTRSYQLLSKRWNISAHIKQTVLLHHENVDGSGYPQLMEMNSHSP